MVGKICTHYDDCYIQICCFNVCYQGIARGRLRRNSRPRGRNFAQSRIQGDVVVSFLIKKKNLETHFHSFIIQTQAVVINYYHYIIFLHPLNGNSTTVMDNLLLN